MKFNPWQKKNKYNAIKTVVDGFKFDSKKEAKYYIDLQVLIKSKAVKMVLRQVPFHLPGGVKYVLDFIVFWASGDIEFVDVKGFKTAEYKLKKKLVEHHFDIDINEV